MPAFLFGKIQAYKIVEGDKVRYFVRTQVANTGNGDGVVNIGIRSQMRDRGRGGGFGGFGGFGPGGRQLEGEERAADALEADPFSGLLQGNRLTIQVEGVAVRNYYPVAHGRTETVEELKVAGPAGRIAATVMESTR